MTKSKKPISLDNINWDHLKRFKLCAENKSFKQAADKIGTSTNALSGQIDTLEKELGFRLFELVNSNRTLKLTDDGNHLFQMVSMAHFYLSGSYPSFHGQIAQKESLPKIKITTTSELADIFLGKIVDAFLREYPHYQIDVIAVTPPINTIDEGIVIQSNIEVQENIIKKSLFEITTNLYASKDYLDKMGKPTKREDLNFHKILGFYISNYNDSDWRLLRTKEFFMQSPILSNSINFLHNMCCAGHGIIELPHIYPRNPSLIPVLENTENHKFIVYFGFHKKNLSKPGISEFTKFLIENCQNF